MLNEAIRIGNAKLVQKLLDTNASIDKYAIYEASCNGYVEIVKLLKRRLTNTTEKSI